MTEGSVRVFGSIPSALLQKLDADAMQKNISRSEWLRMAIEAYLQNGDASVNAACDAELMQLRIKCEQYESMMKQSDQQIAFLQSHVAQLTQSLSQLALTGPRQNEPEPEYEQGSSKTPLWMKLKFWTWV